MGIVRMKLAQAYRVGNLTVVNNNYLTQYITFMAHYIETYCPLERLSAEKAYQKTTKRKRKK